MTRIRSDTWLFTFSHLIFDYIHYILSILSWVSRSRKPFSIVVFMSFVTVGSYSDSISSTLFLLSIMLIFQFHSHVMNTSPSLFFFQPLVTKSLSWNDGIIIWLNSRYTLSTHSAHTLHNLIAHCTVRVSWLFASWIDFIFTRCLSYLDLLKCSFIF